VSDPPPVAEFIGSPTSGIAPLLVSFTNQSTGPITSHAWTFGDGGTSTLASPSHSYATAGTYTVALTETGPGGADTRTRTAYVVVDEAAPVADFVADVTTGPAPLFVSFTNQSSGTVTTHAWTFGDGGTSSASSPSHTYSTPGTYTVTLTETGPGGTDTKTRTDYVVVLDPLPVAAFSATPLRGRSPLPIAFNDLSSGGVTSWSWDFGDGATSTLQNPTHTYLQGGLFTVTLTVTGPTGTDQEIKTNYVRIRGPRR
jgi:PKD repeat protein